MEICVFAETVQVDQVSYEKLIQRVFLEHFQLSIPVNRKLENIIIRGKANLLTQLPYLIGRITRKFSEITCIFVFIDADGEYPTVTNSEKKRVREKIRKFRESFSGEIIIGVPTRNIEAWLLGDIRNINDTTGLSISMDFPKVEEINAPKEEFKKIYSEYRRVNPNRALTYPELVEKLFSTININTLKSHSKSFEKLLNDLRAYLQRSGEL